MNTLRKSPFLHAYTTALFTHFSGMLAGFIDGLLTSAFLGVYSMTAYGLTSPYYGLRSVIIYTFVIGGQSLYTAKIGQNRDREAREVFGLSFYMTMGISLLIAILGVLFSDFLAGFLGAKGIASTLRDETAAYLCCLFLSLPFSNFVSICAGALQLDGGSGLLKSALIVNVVADIIGDLMNVFVFHGGLLGMGIATILSHVCSALIVLQYFLRKKKFFSLDPKYFRLSCLGMILKQGSSQAVYGLASTVGQTVKHQIILAAAGNVGMFAMSVFNNIGTFLNPLCTAAADAVFLLIGLHIGECDRKAAEAVLKTAFRFCLIVLLPIGLLICCLSGLIAPIYVLNYLPQFLTAARWSVVTQGILVSVTAVFLISLKSLIALGKITVTTVLNIVQCLVIPCVMMLLLAPNIGLQGIFLALIASGLLTAVWAFLRLKRELRQSDQFRIPEGNILHRTVSNPAEAVAFSEELYRFCLEKTFSGKTAFALSLCAEEMGCCMLNHPPADEAPAVDFRIILQNGTIDMRISDNCPLLDFRQKALEWSPQTDHPERFIGVRIAFRLSTQLKYMKILDHNHVIITFMENAPKKKGRKKSNEYTAKPLRVL